jgi:hypothetical protein
MVELERSVLPESGGHSPPRKSIRPSQSAKVHQVFSRTTSGSLSWFKHWKKVHRPANEGQIDAHHVQSYGETL